MTIGIIDNAVNGESCINLYPTALKMNSVLL